MHLPALANGFPSPTGGKEKQENIENGDMVGGRIGVSPRRPLRTTNQSPTKNISKPKKPQKNHKILNNQKNSKTINTNKYSKLVKDTVQCVPIFSANGAGVINKLQSLVSIVNTLKFLILKF